jgi:hypothetical protein
MSFVLYNRPLKIWKSIGTPTPKVGAHLRIWGFISSHSPVLLQVWNVTFGLHSWPAPLQALALVVSPKLGLQQQPKQVIIELFEANEKIEQTFVKNLTP